MGLPAKYEVVSVTSESVVIKDLGPWTIHLTITNDAEGIVEEMVPYLHGRRLYYIDTDGEMDELLIKDGKFVGFAPGPRGKNEDH